MKIQTIPLVDVYRAFYQYDFSEDEVTNILIGMVMVWQVNEFVTDVTKEIILTECDLDELSGQLLWNSIGNELVRIAELFRQVRQTQLLLRWSIHTQNILLELADESPNT